MLSRFGDYVAKGRVLVASAAACRSFSSPADTVGALVYVACIARFRRRTKL